jgi:hypothetical protein
MLGRIWSFLSKQVVTDVPDELSACMECGVTQCPDDRFRTCPRRLAQAAALRTARPPPTQQPPTQKPNVTP